MDRSKVAGASFAQGLAAGSISYKCGEMIITRPPCELHPFDRFELAMGEFQWFFGRPGGGRRPQRRAEKACPHCLARSFHKMHSAPLLSISAPSSNC